jgi:hypothetical protein
VFVSGSRALLYLVFRIDTRDLPFRPAIHLVESKWVSQMRYNHRDIDFCGQGN